MNLKIWHRKPGQPGRLPEPVFNYMRHRFIFLPEYLDSLRCFCCRGVFEGTDVTQVRIFSPRRAKMSGLVIDSCTDLDSHPEMLLFEGHIDKHGQAYVADRRLPERTSKIASGH